MTVDHAGPGPGDVLAVIPTIDARRVDRLGRTWGADLAARGVRVVVVANAASVADAGAPDGCRIVSSGRNDGFAASVNLAARSDSGWRWLLVLNDDLDPSPDAVTAILAALASCDDAVDRRSIVVFDPETPRRIPGPAGVLAGVSLLSDVVARVRRTRGGEDSGRAASEAAAAGSPATAPHTADGHLPAGAYTSFSAVAISRGTWDAVGELEELLPFCYEDAEYTRRFARVTGRTPVAAACEVGHAHSSSTKSHIATVLPVVAYSAYRYLQATHGTPLARLVVLAALVVRLPLVPLASAPPRRHAVGVLRALAAVATGTRPHLPDFRTL